MIDCRSVELELEAYLRRRLDEATARAVREHLGSCEACRDEAQALAPIVKTLVASKPPRPALRDLDGLADAVLARAGGAADGPGPLTPTLSPMGEGGQERRQPPRIDRRLARRFSRPVAAWLAAAAVLVAAVVAWRVIGGGGGADPIAQKDEGSRAPEGPAPPGPPGPGTLREGEGSGTEPTRRNGLKVKDLRQIVERPGGPEGEKKGPEGNGEGERIAHDVWPRPPHEEAVPSPPQPGPAPSPGPTIERVRAVLAVVTRPSGSAEVKRSGSELWGRLSEGQALYSNDAIRTGRSALEVALVPGAASAAARGEPGDEGTGAVPAPKAEDGRTALVLAGSSEATMTPPREARALLSLRRGKVYAEAVHEPIEVEAGPAVVLVGAADAAIELAGAGEVEVTVYAGRVAVRSTAAASGGAGDTSEVAAGNRVKVAAGGAIGKPAKAGTALPDWLEAHRAVPAEAVLLDERFRSFEARGYDERFGTLVTKGASGEEVPPFVRGEPDGEGYFAQKVHFGRPADRGGIARYRAGAKLRLRYRISAAADMKVQVNDLDRRDNFHTVVRRHRPDLWTEIELDLDGFRDNAGEGKRMAPDDVLGYVSILAGEPGSPVVLDVARVLLYVPALSSSEKQEER